MNEQFVKTQSVSQQLLSLSSLVPDQSTTKKSNASNLAFFSNLSNFIACNITEGRIPGQFSFWTRGEWSKNYIVTVVTLCNKVRSSKSNIKTHKVKNTCTQNNKRKNSYQNKRKIKYCRLKCINLESKWIFRHHITKAEEWYWAWVKNMQSAK